MSAPIPALETCYKGHRFRSRMEARWAVFMDAISVRWMYELDGYKLPSGVLYLPDFYLPELDAWMEIKNPAADDMEAEEAKVAGLVALTGKPAFLFKFPPAMAKYDQWDETTATKCFLAGQMEPVWDEGYLWCECPSCLRAGIEFTGRAERIDCGCRHEGRLATYDTERLQDAYWLASATRFNESDQ